MMSNKWISHYNENNSTSTGQMICLRHVFKIRTFRKEVDGRASYTVVFESDILGNNGHVTWQYTDRLHANEVIMRIVAGVEDIEYIPVNHQAICDSRLYIDLIRGFEGGKHNRATVL